MKKRLLFFYLFGSLVLINACQKEYSFEGASTPSEGALQNDGTGDCLPKTVAGAYVVGTALVGTTNYIEVQVDVTKIGSYTIYTDTVNGIYFRVKGIFTISGLNTVQLKGFGTPAAAGISNFIVKYGSSECSITVTTSGTLGAFTLDGAPGGCMGAVPSGTYTTGIPLTAANSVTINVNVTAVGAYTISSTLSNGITFSRSGIFTTTGTQSIVLTGTGTPAASGSTNIPVVSGSSSCNFTINVLGSPTTAVFSVDCATAVINGTYTQNTALAAANTITIGVNVSTAGTYTISTTTTNGMTFSASGTFTTTGVQTVTLAGTGTPTVAGANTIPVTNGTVSCNVTVNVVAVAGAATFTVNCGSAVVNGIYTVGTALAVTNTVTIGVTVTTIGSYTITTTATNGMTFSKTGNFAATGAQTVTLTGTGVPTLAGANTIPVPSGTAACNFSVTVLATGGVATFTVDCTSATPNSTYTQGFPLAGPNTVTIGVNVTMIGTYSITTTPTNGITFTATGTFAATGNQTITLAGTGTPTAAGTFTIPVSSGTTPCSFPLIIDPSFGSWSFKVGTTNFSGPIYESALDPTTLAPFLLFYFLGDNPAGDQFEIDLVDIAGGVLANEQYNCATFNGTANTGGVYYVGANNTTYDADPTFPTNTMIVKITSHNTTTKTIIGTFSGKMILNALTTPSLVDITNGQFTVTYP